MGLIAGLEAYALHIGIDGKVLSAVIGTLALLAGWLIPNPPYKKNKEG